jgi:drug/metabolite transporter (DMT)-like permease
MKLAERQKGIAALVGLAVIYASLGLFSRFLSTNFLLFQQVYLRMLFAFLLGFLFFYQKLNFSKLRKISFKEWLLLMFRAAGYYLLGVLLFTKASLLIKISTLSFIGSLPMTATLSFILLQEKPTFKKFIYITLAFIGVTIISVKDYSSLFTWGQGELLALISCIFASLSIVFRKYQTKLLNNFEISQIMLFFAFIFVLIGSLIFKEGFPVNNWNANVLAVVLVAGVVNILLILFTNYGFEKVQISLASNILTLEMLFAVILGFLFYKEIPTAKDLIGAVLILYGVIQMNKLE